MGMVKWEWEWGWECLRMFRECVVDAGGRHGVVLFQKSAIATRVGVNDTVCPGRGGGWVRRLCVQRLQWPRPCIFSRMNVEDSGRGNSLLPLGFPSGANAWQSQRTTNPCAAGGRQPQPFLAVFFKWGREMAYHSKIANQKSKRKTQNRKDTENMQKKLFVPNGSLS